MITYSQMGLKKRYRTKRFTWSPQLFRCPQVKGRILKFFTTSPKKPNSARRKTAKIALTNRKIVFGKLIGEGYLPQKYSLVLIRGKGYKDTPQVNYTMIRGALECLPIFNKKRRRSLFGAPKYNKVVELNENT